VKLAVAIGLITALSVLAAPLAADAQRPVKVPRIGVLMPGRPPSLLLDAFRRGLRERPGWSRALHGRAGASPAFPGSLFNLKAAQGAAPALGLTVQPLEVRSADASAVHPHPRGPGHPVRRKDRT
jgi:hypothetical protein